jgi:UDP-N-acetylmuramate--alanine ligase
MYSENENMIHIHLIGIGGIGMSGLAEYYARKGYTVTGSDLIKTKITERLEKFGVKIFYNHNENNITSGIAIVIHTSAVKDDNPEYRKAKNLNIKLIKRAQALADIVNEKILIAIAGTHGKTSTTSMVAKVLIDAGFDPLVFAGGNIDFLDGGSSRFSESRIAVVEADEYDRSFLTLKPDFAVINNIEEDHLDIYKDINEIKDTFSEFLSNVKPQGKLIVNGDDENVKAVIKKFDKKNIIMYGQNVYNHYQFRDYEVRKNTVHFYLSNAEIVLKIIGKHNAYNAAAAFTVSKLLNVNERQILKSLFEYSGVDRRLELKYSNDFTVYDDYAHHPTEISASLDAVRSFTNNRLVTVFQPHLYSRTKDFYKEFARSLDLTDVLVLADLYPAREKPIEGVSSELLFNEFKNISSKPVYNAENYEALKNILKTIIMKNDVIVFQGAGNITDYCEKFIKEIKS